MSNYVTTADVDTYAATRLNVEGWTAASAGNKTACVTMATQAIDLLNYAGDKASDAQDNQFPRGDDTSVPTDITNAACEIALALADGVDPEMEFENLSMVSQGYANIRTTYDRRQPPMHLVHGIPSATAWRYLAKYLRDPFRVVMSRISKGVDPDYAG